MLRQRFIVERVGQQRLRRQGLLARQAPAELLLHRDRPPAKRDLLLAVVGTEKDQLPRLGAHTRPIQHRPQPHARPASVAR